MKESISVDEICHKHSIGFIKADICGVFASVFCDFGKGFQVLDVDGGVTDASIVSDCLLGSESLLSVTCMASAMEHGFGLLLLRIWPLTTCKCIAGEEPATGIVASITPGNPTLVTCVDDERMDFQASSSVTHQCRACLMHSSI